MRSLRAALPYALVCSLAALGWGMLAADTPETSRPAAGPPGSEPFQVPQCRVRLMDEVQLASEQTGILEDLAGEGRYVAGGSTVAQLRDQSVRASLAMAEREATNDIDVRFAGKASEHAQLKYIRAVEANRSAAGTVPELDLRELRLGAEKSLLQLEQAEHQFAMAGLKRDEIRILLETYRVAAPFDAFVSEVFRKPGEVVRAGEPILTLVNTARVRVEGFIALEDIERVWPGQPVEVIADSGRPGSRPPELIFPGRLAFVDVKVEPVSGKVRIWAEVLNRENRLRDGLTATMLIHPPAPSGSSAEPVLGVRDW